MARAPFLFLTVSPFVSILPVKLLLGYTSVSSAYMQCSKELLSACCCKGSCANDTIEFCIRLWSECKFHQLSLLVMAPIQPADLKLVLMLKIQTATAVSSYRSLLISSPKFFRNLRQTLPTEPRGRPGGDKLLP